MHPNEKRSHVKTWQSSVLTKAAKEIELKGKEVEICNQAAELHHKDLKIQALTLELAHLRRIRYGVKNEALTAVQRDIFRGNWHPLRPNPNGAGPVSSQFLNINPVLSISINRKPANAVNVAMIWLKYVKISPNNWTWNQREFFSTGIFVRSMPANTVKPSPQPPFPPP